MEFSYVRLGQAQLDGDTEALFRDQFIPYLLTTFDAKRVMRGFVRHKEINKGKSASFPLFGTMGAKYVGIGERVLGNQTIAKNEVTIKIDPYLVSDAVVYDLEEKMSETQDRQIIADEMAKALANTEDKQLLQVGVLAARSGSLIVNENRGGSVIKAGATVNTDPAVLAAAIYAAGVELDVKNVDDEGRNCFVRPLQYSLLCQYENIADKNIGGGSYEKGTTGMLDNIKIIKTNHLPNTNITQSLDTTNPRNVYYGDFTNTAALVMTGDAIGTVTLKKLITEVSWNPEYFHHLLTARIAQGHGILRPECAVEISAASPTSGSGS